MPTFPHYFFRSIHIVSMLVEKNAQSQPFSTFFSKMADFFSLNSKVIAPMTHLSLCSKPH